MKRIYFIRHGESEGNIGQIRQTKSTSLTNKGHKQVALVAKRCKDLAIDSIICSSMNRAKETADIILKKISKPIEYSDIFIERRRPSVLSGKAKDDPISLQAEAEIDEKFHIPNFRFSDEENFDDLNCRAGDALDFLIKQKNDDILVITHGFFLRIIIAKIIFQNNLTGVECKRFIDVLETNNTGITIVEYDKTLANNPWGVRVWNDHAHLG